MAATGVAVLPAMLGRFAVESQRPLLSMSPIIASCPGPSMMNGSSGSIEAMLLRAFAVWLLILLLEVLHGVVRTLWLLPLVGDLPSRQIGVLTGSALILLVAWLTIGWIGARTRTELIVVGGMWLVLVLLAEIVLGRLVFGFAWSRLLEDFDLARGGLLGVGMAVLFAAPALALQFRPSLLREKDTG